MKNGDKPAFSSLHTIDGNWQKEPLKEYQGLTKREYFAAMALQGLCASQGWASIQGTVDQSIKIADELLKQLEL